MDMERMATIGLDIAKSVFQVHGIGKNGSVVLQRQLRRSQVLAFFSKQSLCVVGLLANVRASRAGARLYAAVGFGLAVGDDIRLVSWGACQSPHGPRRAHAAGP
jgi:hypothetical protein